MVKVFNAKIDMEGVVDSGGELVDFFFVDGAFGVEVQVVANGLEGGRGLCLFFAFEDADVFAVVEDADDFFVSFLQNADVFQEFVFLRGAEGDVGCFDFEDKGDVGDVFRQVPAVGFVGDAGKSELIECGELSDACGGGVAVFESQNFFGFASYDVFCAVCCHGVLLIKCFYFFIITDAKKSREARTG